MKRTFLVAALCFSVFALAGEITSNFTKVSTLKTGLFDGGSVGVGPVGTAGPFVKVSCLQDAYVGASNADAGGPCMTLTDGGPPCFNTCVPLSDGGLPCDVIWFSQYQKFYVKMLNGQDHVSAYMLDGGIQTCTAFEARN